MRRHVSSPTSSLSDISPPPPSQPRTYEQMMPTPSGPGPSNFPGPGPINLSPPFMEQVAMLGYSQASGYNQPPFMDYMREFLAARERIKQLELENARISSERDTLRDVLNCKGEQLIDPQLRSTTAVSSKSLSRADGPSGLPSVAFAPLETPKSDFHPTLESHPKIRFWTQKDYNNFLDSPQGQRTLLERGQVGYLEELDGTIASQKRVETLRSCIRSVWLELAHNNRAPQTWKGMDASSYKYFRSFVEEAHPLFKCAIDSWKLNTLACSTYPAWRAHYLDGNGKLLSKEERKRRRGVKSKVEPASDNEDSPLSRKKPRLSEGNLNTVSTSEESCATTSTTTCSPASGSTFSNTSASDTSNSEPESCLLPPNVPSESSAKTVIKDSPTPEAGGCLDERVMHINPLNDLAQVASSLGISVPDDVANPPPPVPDSKSNTPIPENTKSDTTLPLPSELHSTPGPSKKEKKITKMRPGPGKNGRNLCAHQWLRVFKNTTKGTLTEFNEYYKMLSKEQQEAYDKEAEELVANDAWNKEAFNGKIY